MFWHGLGKHGVRPGFIGSVKENESLLKFTVRMLSQVKTRLSTSTVFVYAHIFCNGKLNIKTPSSSHVDPFQPSVHLHFQPDWGNVSQVPPFLQGFGWHALSKNWGGNEKNMAWNVKICLHTAINRIYLQLQNEKWTFAVRRIVYHVKISLFKTIVAVLICSTTYNKIFISTETICK